MMARFRDLRCPALFTWLLAAWVACLPARAQDDDYAGELKGAQNALLRGQYLKARAGFDEILAAAEEEAEADRPTAATVLRARAGLLSIDLAHGKYDAVRDAIAALPAADRQDRELRLLLARSHQARGRLAEAETEYAALLAVGDDYEVRYRLGTVQVARGEHTAAAATFGYAVGKPPVSDGVQLAYQGQCLVALGGRDKLEAASGLFVAAVKAAPERPEALLFFGNLKFEVYREAAGLRSGETDLKKVLDQNGDHEEALISLYKIRRANFQLDPSRTEDYLRRALALNPSSVPALIEQASILLDDRRLEDGAAVLDRALAVNPVDKLALAHRAAAALLLGQRDEEAKLRERLAAIDQRYFEVDRVVGEHLMALYRFADAVPFLEQALAKMPESVPTLDALGKALVYAGRGNDARVHLEKAKALQPGFVNPWRHNALAIQDALERDYKMVEKGGFRFFFHKDDFGVLAEYMVPLHLDAMQQLGLKYSYQPNGLVRVECLHEWADFSVRTIGFRGFSALGACFGNFLTLVSPGDDGVRRQDFMWSATVWHEYAHVLTLGLSKARVPRWLTEGFSVHEERARNRTWERGMERQLLDYWRNDRIYPVRELNRAFRGPDILFGYYQGGLIVDYLAERHGFAKVVEMLKLYGEDLPQEDIFQRAFGISTERFDREFKQWVFENRLANLKLVTDVSDARFDQLVARANAGKATPQELVQLGWGCALRGNEVDAARFTSAVLKQQADHGPGLLLLAELQRRRGALDEAVATWQKAFATGAEDFDSRMRYGDALEKREQLEAALEQYQFGKRCWPRCTDQGVAPHLRAARVLRKLGRLDEAAAELAAFCGLTGRAFQPRLELAAYYRGKGDRRQEVRYLEEANQIDPFQRSLHEQLGDAYVVEGRAGEALREYRVALAVPTKLDREYLDAEGGPPDEGAPEVRLARGKLWLKLAKLHREQLDHDGAARALDEAAKAAPDSEIVDEVERLREAWRK